MLLLALLVATPAAAAQKRAKRRPSAATAAPAKKPAARAIPSPAATPEPPPSPPSSARSAPAPERAPPKASEVPRRTALSLAAGAFYGGGFNRGVWISSGWTTPWQAPTLGLAAEVDLAYRLAQFRREQAGYGELTSALHAIPLLAAGRFEALRIGGFSLDARAGLGPMFLVHHLASTFSNASTRFAVGWEAFAGGQARLKVASVELLLDARYALGEARMPFVVGRATGLQAALGVRVPLQ